MDYSLTRRGVEKKKSGLGCLALPMTGGEVETMGYGGICPMAIK
jgi:hypothetical protein